MKAPGYTLTLTVTRHPDPLHEITGIPEDPAQTNEIGGVYECADLFEVAATMQAAVRGLRAVLGEER